MTDWTIAYRAMVCPAGRHDSLAPGARQWECASQKRTGLRAVVPTSLARVLACCLVSVVWHTMRSTTLAAQGTTGDSSTVRVCMGGDVSLGTNLDTTWVDRAAKWMRHRPAALPEPSHLLAPLVPMLNGAGADLVLVNLEGAIGDSAVGADTTAKCTGATARCYALRMPTSAASALRHLRDSGEVVANVANNHSRDAGISGLTHTLAALERAGVHVTGADTMATPVVTARGDTVAFLGFGSSGEPDARNLAAVRRHVSRAAARYPRLVVTMHLGAEGAKAQRTRDTMETFLDERRGNPVAFAHAAVDAGATLVVGHGPHVVRAIEWRNGALIAYSLGNLVTYGPFALDNPLDRGALLCATMDRHGAVSGVRLISTRQRAPGLVRADPRARAAVLADSLSKLDFPKTGARLVVEATVREP